MGETGFASTAARRSETLFRFVSIPVVLLLPVAIVGIMRGGNGMVVGIAAVALAVILVLAGVFQLKSLTQGQEPMALDERTMEFRVGPGLQAQMMRFSGIRLLGLVFGALGLLELGATLERSTPAGNLAFPMVMLALAALNWQLPRLVGRFGALSEAPAVRFRFSADGFDVQRQGRRTSAVFHGAWRDFHLREIDGAFYLIRRRSLGMQSFPVPKDQVPSGVDLPRLVRRAPGPA